MIFSKTLLGFLLASHASATSHALFSRSHDAMEHLQRDTNLVATLTRRQDANPADTAPRISTTPASGDAAMADLAKWEAETKAACDTAMTALNGRASNPTGLGVCYNLPFLDNSTGVFLAELRLYNITAPIDPWRGIAAADIDLALSYSGATVQNMPGTFQKRSAPNGNNPLSRRQNNNAQTPETLKVLMYVGQLNANLMGTAMTQEILQPLLIPMIELSSRSRPDLKAGLTSQDASFVNGVFAAQGPTVTDEAAAAASASALVATAVPFVLPGTALAFFPVGLVITCVWTALFLLSVGLGTVGRMQFREQYRRRIKREMAAGLRTI
ncbi:uncharacterized protein EI97DRAFT_171922 [Westerdykella ornata]|uniref:Uncharacterized protein n=1 Tax=Westerdykella ornata TaxID=318751 RepID=A0A6A6JSC7_WESOR|nr:uncharacterized protein EI97DRAFT_171922 [Westerdykella ornata]KAF2279297.1 hypothetical protein EI97DRAFT_171922 [Westerdykella ornata]